MVEIKFNDGAVMERIHKALVGSPAYINSEIAICEDQEGFTLVVGKENDDNCLIEVDAYCMPN